MTYAATGRSLIIYGDSCAGIPGTEEAGNLARIHAQSTWFRLGDRQRVGEAAVQPADRARAWAGGNEVMSDKYAILPTVERRLVRRIGRRRRRPGRA